MYNNISKKNTIGFSGKYLRYGDMAYTSITGTTIRKSRPYELSGNISFSHKMSHNFSIGVIGKYIYSDLGGGIAVINPSTQAGRSLAMDVSCYKKDTIDFIKSDDVFAWGVNISNVGSKISYSAQGQKDFLPQSLRIGLSYKINLAKHHSLELICEIGRAHV